MEIKEAEDKSKIQKVHDFRTIIQRPLGYQRRNHHNDWESVPMEKTLADAFGKRPEHQLHFNNRASEMDAMRDFILDGEPLAKKKIQRKGNHGQR